MAERWTQMWSYEAIETFLKERPGQAITVFCHLEQWKKGPITLDALASYAQDIRVRIGRHKSIDVCPSDVS